MYLLLVYLALESEYSAALIPHDLLVMSDCVGQLSNLQNVECEVGNAGSVVDVASQAHEGRRFLIVD